MREALQAFNERAQSADLALVFFAGHGMEFGGKNYLIPTDAKLAAEEDIEWEVVPLDLVLTASQPSRIRIIILDACRNNPLVPAMVVAQPSRGAATAIKRTTAKGLPPWSTHQAIA